MYDIFINILNKIKKILGAFFSKGKIKLFFNRFTPFSPNLDLFQKSGSVTIEPLWIPNFIPKIRKIVGAVFKISCDGWTDERD